MDINIKSLFLPISDSRYSKLLYEIPDAPAGLYVLGDAMILCNRCIGVVGTRKMTTYGETVTKTLTADLVKAGFTIVSGMAIGIDSVAHKTALECGGKTIAVLGCGIDVIYPSVNTQLYRNIIQRGGCIVSEFPPKSRTTTAQFTSRNRIISGLSVGVVVTEGAKRSGTMITAKYAAEQGREVFAVPGPITSELSDGTANLIKNGAKVVTGIEDILEEFST